MRSPWSRPARWAAALLTGSVALAGAFSPLALAGEGEPAPPPPIADSEPAPPPVPKAPLEPLGGPSVLGLVLDLDEARRFGLLQPADQAAAVLAETVRILEARLSSVGFGAAGFVLGEQGHLEVRLPADADPEAARKLVCARGTIEFRIEVRPEYPDPLDESRVRSEVWQGASARSSLTSETTFPTTKQGFAEFRAFELARWKAARDRHEPYRASDQRYRLVPKANARLEVAEDFVILEEPTTAAERFGNEVLGDARPWRGMDLENGVQAAIKAELGAAFAKWTGHNVGLPLALVVNGEWISAPTIRDALEDNLIIMLPSLPGVTAPSDQEVLRIIAYLESGPLRVEPRLVSYGRVDSPK